MDSQELNALLSDKNVSIQKVSQVTGIGLRTLRCVQKGKKTLGPGKAKQIRRAAE